MPVTTNRSHLHVVSGWKPRPYGIRQKERRRRPPLRGWVAAVVLGSLQGCAALSDGSRDSEGEALSSVEASREIDWSEVSRTGGKAADDPEAEAGDGGEAGIERDSRDPQLFLGTGTFVEDNADAEAIREDNSGDVTLNFQDTEIREVILTIFGELLDENVAIHPRVSGRVTFETSRPLNREMVLPVLESLLSVHGYTFVRKDGHYQVLPESEAGRAGGDISLDTVPSDTYGQSILVVPLQFVSVSEIRNVLEPILPQNAILQADGKRNVLLITGTDRALSRARDMARMFDVDWMEGMSIGLLPVQYGDVEDLVEQLRFIFQDDGDESSQNLVRILALDRLNAVLVVSQQAAYVERAKDWTERLDRPSEDGGRSLYVYEVENTRASDLATVLNSVFSGTTQEGRNGERAGSVGRPTEGGLAPGMTSGVIETDDEGYNAPEAQSDESASPPPSPSVNEEEGPVPSLGAGEGVQIMAQPNSNALLIMANAREYRAIEDAIEKLDQPPLQVLVDATIVEVTLTDELSYGLQWFFNTHTGEFSGEGTVGRELDFSEAFSFTLSSEGQIRSILQALSQETQLRVLSAPSLMVLNNHEAQINVGEQIPLITQRSTSVESADAPTLQQIEMRDTGVLLELLPRVNSGGLVTMEIRQEVSDPGEIDATGSRSIQQRQIASTVSVQSGNTVVLGGLMRENRFHEENGVPGLRDLPLIGGVFGQTTRTSRATELLVLITPRVIDNRAKQKAVLEEFRDKLQGLKRFNWDRVLPLNQSGTGSPEPNQHNGAPE